jgi:hypothetical protein
LKRKKERNKYIYIYIYKITHPRKSLGKKNISTVNSTNFSPFFGEKILELFADIKLKTLLGCELTKE